MPITNSQKTRIWVIKSNCFYFSFVLGLFSLDHSGPRTEASYWYLALQTRVPPPVLEHNSLIQDGSSGPYAETLLPACDLELSHAPVWLPCESSAPPRRWDPYKAALPEACGETVSSRVGVPNLWNLVPDDLRWSWLMITKIKCK